MPRATTFAGGITLALIALAGCSTQPSTKSYHANMSNAQEVPATTGNGRGTANVSLDPGTRQITWTVTYIDLTGDATGAHIHGPAAPGANAAIVVNLAPSGLKSPLQGSATLTDAQIADLQSGNYYVNVHTAQNKGGEIRGQLVP
jgi:hypothetical protein